MINPDEDGITHINIYSKGKTELGRKLSNFAHTPFSMDDYGEVASVEALWYYLRTGQNQPNLKSLYGYTAKKVGRSLMERYPDQIVEIDDNFKEAILEGIRCKLRQNKDILTLLVRSDLPLEHYYYYGKGGNYKVYDLPEYKWMTEEIERIRQICKEHVRRKLEASL